SLDGRVLIAGGSNGAMDLRTAELYDPVFETFTLLDTQMSAPRHGHAAVLLPHNNALLIAGGTSKGAAVATTDLFLPAEFPDPFSWSIGTFAPTAPMTTPRVGAIGGPAGDAGYAFA